MAKHPHDAEEHPLSDLTKIESIALGQVIRSLENAVEKHVSATASGVSTDQLLAFGEARRGARRALTGMVARLIKEHNE